VFTNNTNRDTLERTGPGAFTDVIVRQFWLHSKTSRAAKDVRRGSSAGAARRCR